MTNILSLRDVSFAYRNTPAIRACTLDIPSNTLFGILGPNGAGKTTLLKLMAGLFSPTQGTVTWHGQPLQTIAPRTRAQQITFVPQITQDLYPLRVRDLIALGRTPYQSGLGWETATDRAAIDHALELMHCTSFADRYLHTLSSGERQRALIARALAQQPQLLLLDEPIAHLDPAAQHEVMTLLHTLHQQHSMTIGVVLHDVHLAQQYCGMLGLLSHGRLLQWGPTSAIATAEHLSETFGIPMEWKTMLIPQHDRISRAT